MSANDHFMRRAFRLACLGSGRAHPNPMVGAVVVRAGKVIGQGTHLFNSIKHAEIIALEEAGDNAQGADLYVTLEPCSHHGRTPPCAETIAATGIRRVFCGMADPNPLVSGRGVDLLRRHGIEVNLEPDPSLFQELNRAYITFISAGRPWVILKAALTLDGRLAPASGNSKWITSERARRYAHRLRFYSDAILIGIGTVLADDPELTCRYKRSKDAPLLRAVIDPSLKTPLHCQLVQQATEFPLVLYCIPGAPPELRQSLESRGVQVHEVDISGGQTMLSGVLNDLACRRIGAVLVEGGSQTLTGFVREKLADEFFFFYGPKLLGEPAVPALWDIGQPELKESPPLEIHRVEFIPPDVLICGRFHF